MMNCGFPPTEVEDEYEKLLIRMKHPRVTVDNNSSCNTSLVTVDGANKQGSLLEVVQVLTDLKLSIKRAYISSDGEWFMDVFHVVDQDGEKLCNCEVINSIEQSLVARAHKQHSLKRSVGVEPAAEHTIIELIGKDRPGLLSEVFAVLRDHKCNIVAAEVWTHNSKMASVVYITDDETGGPIDDTDRLAKIKHLLRYVLKGNRDKHSAKTAISVDTTHIERRLHQMMFADQDYTDIESINRENEDEGSFNHKNKPFVTVENCVEKDYTVVNIKCKDRAKVLFDTVCTLTDMQYIVFHAIILVEGAEANQEYYIRKLDGCAVGSLEERKRLVQCLENAIGRRNAEGMRLELCCDDRVGLLSEITRIFRENGLSVIQAEVSTRGSQAVNAFYVVDASGNQVQSQVIDAVRREIGQTILHVKDDSYSSSPTEDTGKFSFGNLFKSRSEKFLYNLGLIKSYS